MAKIFIILGILAFVKQLPQFIEKPTTDKINQALAGYKSLEDDPTGLAYISAVEAVTEYVSANGDSADGIENVELFNKLKLQV